MKESLFKFLFAFSLVFLIFLSGYTAAWYHLRYAHFFDSALQGFEAWRSQEELVEHPVVHNNQQAAFAGRRHKPHPDPGSDFPAAVDVWDRVAAFEGYTLITGQFGSQAYLIDMEGTVVHHWSLPFSEAWPEHPQISHPWNDERITWFRAKVFPNGDLLVDYTANGDTPYGYGLAKIDKNSNLIWKYSENVHHDFDIAPDGDIYTLVQKIEKDPVDERLPTLRLPTIADYVVKLSSRGKELQRVSIVKAFLDSPYSSILIRPNLGNKIGDFTHTNSIQLLTPELAAKFPEFKAGQVLISIREWDTIAVLDLDKKAVVWAAQGQWKKQHGAQFVNNGHILLFDNQGYYTNRNQSRVLEIDPMTHAVPWLYVSDNMHPFYNDAGGEVQRLENGNTLILSAMDGHAFEVTPDHRIVWSYHVRRQFNDELPNSKYFLLQTAIRYKISELPFLKDTK